MLRKSVREVAGGYRLYHVCLFFLLFDGRPGNRRVATHGIREGLPLQGRPIGIQWRERGGQLGWHVPGYPVHAKGNARIPTLDFRPTHVHDILIDGCLILEGNRIFRIGSMDGFVRDAQDALDRFAHRVVALAMEVTACILYHDFIGTVVAAKDIEVVAATNGDGTEEIQLSRDGAVYHDFSEAVKGFNARHVMVG